MEIEVIKAVLENNVDLKQKSTSLIVHLREQTHNALYYELVFLALFFCESFPGGRSESLKILTVIEKVILKN